jgi:cytidylate kinase
MSQADSADARRIVIAIDGPAASGKSSTAQWVARRLGFSHVDSGALYRAATEAALRTGVDPEGWTEARVLLAVQSVSLVRRESSLVPSLDGVDVDESLRSPDVTRHVSQVAQMPRVRLWVNAQVRAAAMGHDLVVDGRDMGTAVFPSADLKVYLSADPWERARRRLTQRLGRAPNEDEIAEETGRLVHRDALDATQSVPARDAVLVDTTLLTQEEQVERIVALARAAMHRTPPVEEPPRPD